MTKIKELLGQLSLVFKNKTIDAIFPPVLFFILNRWLPLTYASGLTVLFLVIVIIYRKYRKQTKTYAFVGFAGVFVSIGFSLLSGEAIDYYIPDLALALLLILAAGGSLIKGYPLAALLSHLTRGWPLAWYQRKDIYPAYKQVTWIWLVYFSIRFFLQGYFFINRSMTGYFLVNTVLGMPMNVIILLISYLYGVAKLRRLEGPSVDEFRQGKKPPYEGQGIGF